MSYNGAQLIDPIVLLHLEIIATKLHS